MPNAEYYINKVFHEIKTVEEAKELFEEVNEWVKITEKKEIQQFCDSGAGETLYMMVE